MSGYKLYSSYILLIIFVFSSCITSKKVNYMQEPGFDIPTLSDSVGFQDYRLKVGDRIFIKVYSKDEETNAIFNGVGNNMQSILSGSGSSRDLYTYLIESNGSATFPVLGEVKVVGQTIREATETLEKAIEPLYEFSTLEIRLVGRNFSVIGGGQSGYFNMPREKINIFQALAMAGDVGIFADRSKIRILRETDNGVQVKKFDIRSADIINSEFFYIEPNDVIYIQALNEQIFSITSLSGLFSTVISTFSFGVLLYDTYDRLSSKKANQ